jgi:Cd2+/Zn2+-exporting ATPase
VTTITGATGLWLAIMADTGATILVTLNALRLLRLTGREQDRTTRDRRKNLRPVEASA